MKNNIFFIAILLCLIIFVGCLEDTPITRSPPVEVENPNKEFFIGAWENYAGTDIPYHPYLLTIFTKNRVFSIEYEHDNFDISDILTSPNLDSTLIHHLEIGSKIRICLFGESYTIFPDGNELHIF
jgi:hypothetical protein